jgi:ABC-type phosphate transport system ATPase subunit
MSSSEGKTTTITMIQRINTLETMKGVKGDGVGEGENILREVDSATSL